MNNITTKVTHVMRAGQTRAHRCHWPDCPVEVPPAMWGCRAHWYSLPKHFRDAIWATYRPGQENDGKPSRAYVIVAQQVRDWITQHLHNRHQRLPLCRAYAHYRPTTKRRGRS